MLEISYLLSEPILLVMFELPPLTFDLVSCLKYWPNLGSSDHKLEVIARTHGERNTAKRFSNLNTIFTIVSTRECSLIIRCKEICEPKKNCSGSYSRPQLSIYSITLHQHISSFLYSDCAKLSWATVSRIDFNYQKHIRESVPF